MSKLLDALFGCRHERCTFPITARSTHPHAGQSASPTYIVCLDCGKEFAYDWQKMKVVTSVDQAA